MEQSKEEILKQALIDAYNAGYTDAQVNHVNDAENYVSELLYASKVFTIVYDGEIMKGPYTEKAEGAPISIPRW